MEDGEEAKYGQVMKVGGENRHSRDYSEKKQRPNFDGLIEGKEGGKVISVVYFFPFCLCRLGLWPKREGGTGHCNKDS